MYIQFIFNLLMLIFCLNLCESCTFEYHNTPCSIFVIVVIFEGVYFCVVQRGPSHRGSKVSAALAVSVAATTARTAEPTWCLCL